MLKGALHLHLFLQTVDELNLSFESVLIILALAEFLIFELTVTAIFFLLNLLTLSVKLFLLALAEEFNVLVLEVLVHTALFQLINLTALLLLHLFVELVTDQAAALLLAKHCLLLLFVVQQGVELLDGCPLVLLGDLRVDFGASIHLAGGDAHLVSVASMLTNTHRLGATAGTSDGALRADVVILSSTSGLRHWAVGAYGTNRTCI